jgi:hypothetical protein
MKYAVLFFLCVLLIVVTAPLPGKFSYVYNENGRLASGLIHLKTGDFSIFHVNPPLPDSVGAVPSFFAKTYCPTVADIGFSHFGRMEYKAGDVWIKKNPDHFRWIKYGRFCMTVFIFLGMVICSIGTRENFGNFPAVIVALLWLFSPYILGHGCLISPDVPSAAFAAASIYFFWKWLKRPEMLEAFFAGIILGLAELTKFTLLIFYPLFIVIWLIYRLPEMKTMTKNDWLQQFKQITVIFVSSILIINMGYLFEGTGKLL